MKLLVLFAIFAAFVVSTFALKDDICRQPHSRNGDTFSCEAYIPSWSYDSSNNKCVSFIYGGCQGNDNRFFTKEECEAKCLK